MLELIKKYYQAWELKDETLLDEVLHQTFYGIRTVNEKSIFTKEELLAEMNETDFILFSLDLLHEENDIIDLKAVMTINNVTVKANIKVTITDGKISKIYEQVELDCIRIKCVVSYDGSGFCGYQRQPNDSSIQEAIESVLARITDEEITIHSSGRTDKGVHAFNQVFHFDTTSKIEPTKFSMVLNSYLPDSIHIKSSEKIVETFHSRYDVKAKEYMYKINTKEFNPIQRNYEWFIEDFDFEIFERELESIKGVHDFTSFTKTQKNHSNVREIYDVRMKQKDNHVYIYITGNGFLRYMVRNIIGAIYSISKGKSQYTMKELLELKDSSLVKEKAPAAGLYLYKVTY